MTDEEKLVHLSAFFFLEVVGVGIRNSHLDNEVKCVPTILE